MKKGKYFPFSSKSTINIVQGKEPFFESNNSIRYGYGDIFGHTSGFCIYKFCLKGSASVLTNDLAGTFYNKYLTYSFPPFSVW